MYMYNAAFVLQLIFNSVTMYDVYKFVVLEDSYDHKGDNEIY
jgi:hypothetical protein